MCRIVLQLHPSVHKLDHKGVTGIHIHKDTYTYTNYEVPGNISGIFS